jgi:hypothetical protein
MDKKVAGLLGAAAAPTRMSTAQAAPARGPELPQPTSYRDLLDPIPNAVPLLKADDERLAQAGGVRIAQVGVGHHHHHHGARVYVRVARERTGITIIIIITTTDPSERASMRTPFAHPATVVRTRGTAMPGIERGEYCRLN